MKIKIVCKICKKEFEAEEYRLKKYNVQFCSRKCKGIANQGNPSWNKGLKLSDKHKENLSISHKKPELKEVYVNNFGIYAIKNNNHSVWNKGLSGYKTKPHYRHRGHIPWNKGMIGFMALEKHYNWKGGISFEPYPLGWTHTFKEQIRFRDGYRCQLCGIPEIENNRKLDVHHINYDKKNINELNLISLCSRCHIKTNYNREVWKNLLQQKMEEKSAKITL